MSREPQTTDPHETGDVGIFEIILYGVGTLGPCMATASYALFTPLMVITLMMSPILAGLILFIKTILTAFTDPIMASITDNAHTRWGRRRPFMLVGGLLLSAICLCMWTFVPHGGHVLPNSESKKPAPVAAVSNATGSAASTATAAVVPSAPAKKKSTFTAGLEELKHTPPHKRVIFYYMTAVLLLMAVIQAIFGVPYYALGIEIAPSYHGRTRVVAYRSIFDKLMGFLSPWFLPFCLWTYFAHGIQGAQTLMWIMLCLAIPSIIIASVFTHERTHSNASKKKVRLLTSMGATLKNRHFLKIAALYIIIQLSLGLFSQLGLFINIYYVFGGDKQAGSIMGGKVGSLGALLALAGIPLVLWLCRRFQKHNALALALLLMAVGSVLNWFCLTPEHPERQYILPFFFSLGISSTYTVLSTLMADVTDVDELNTGTRREGMFGAVMGWMQKVIGSVQALAAGIVLAATGFNAELGANQAEGVMTNMRILFSFAPACGLLISMLILYKYPLTRKRMEEIKTILAERKAAAAATG